METVVGVTTHNPVATMRLDLLEETLRSLERAFPRAVLCLLSNGSTDGSDEAIGELCEGRWYVKVVRPEDASDLADGAFQQDQLWSPGAGRNRLMAHMLETSAKLAETLGWSIPKGGVVCVWSDDDMRWREGAQATLERFWDSPELQHPTKVAILSGLMEPDYHWNTPREIVEHNGVKVLSRDSCPGAAFTFSNHRPLYPLSPQEGTFGYDHKVSQRLLSYGMLVAQIDLAEHIGWGRSTHGNDADGHVDARPLDERWRI